MEDPFSDANKEGKRDMCTFVVTSSEDNKENKETEILYSVTEIRKVSRDRYISLIS